MSDAVLSQQMALFAAALMFVDKAGSAAAEKDEVVPVCALPLHVGKLRDPNEHEAPDGQQPRRQTGLNG